MSESQEPTAKPTGEEDTNQLAEDSQSQDAAAKRKREEDEPADNVEDNEDSAAKKAKSEAEQEASNAQPAADGNGAAETNGEAPSSDANAEGGVTAPATEASAAVAAPTAAAVDAAAAAAALPDGYVTKMLEVAPDKVGQIIGSKGMIIQDIQTRSGARAHVNQDFPPGVNRQVSLTGTAAAVEKASELINLIINEGPTAIHVNSLAGGPVTTSVLECSQNQVGKIIGSGGATIKELQSRSGARIQIEQDFPPEVPRKINITGTAPAVALAMQLVQGIMAGNALGGAVGGAMGGGMVSAYGPAGGAGGAGAGGSQVMEVPKSAVGKIIGRGGETITGIQRRSGARVQVDQNVPAGAPNKVNISGTPQAIGMAMQLINEVLAGGAGGMMGGAMGGAAAGMYGAQMAGQMGMYGGMPQMAGQQFGAYGGMPQQQMMMMQPQAAYGMPAGQQYGQYGAAATAQYGQYGQQQQQPQQQQYGAQATGQVQPQAAAKPAGTASVWTEHKTDDGISYWYNASTGTSQWERPKN